MLHLIIIERESSDESIHHTSIHTHSVLNMDIDATEIELIRLNKFYFSFTRGDCEATEEMVSFNDFHSDNIFHILYNKRMLSLNLQTSEWKHVENIDHGFKEPQRPKDDCFADVSGRNEYHTFAQSNLNQRYMIIARSYLVAEYDEEYGETDLLCFDKKTMKFKEYIYGRVFETDSRYEAFGDALYHNGYIFMHIARFAGECRESFDETIQHIVHHSKLKFDFDLFD